MNIFSSSNKTNIELGDTAKDSISGFTGVVVAVTEWLYNCKRITLQPKELKDGIPIDSHTFDSLQLILIEKAGKHIPEYQKTGGPSIQPVRTRDPK